ncbi:MAG: ParB N-terminal domain-containing protein [Candidatus Poribacteria bacterium]|nr:ParB N-terminal domain-containing protein [Candidatus Poribacteria bacterium]
MMKKLWIDPNDLADVWTVNNRKENPGHIESLAESMRLNGYLPKYPIIAFEAANIPIETDKPYLVACGHHRRKAAIAAEIDLIHAEVHDGTEEEWIEMMSLDNFQFDVVSNPGIGLAFTEQERRAACFQLLLLPKYLRKTNVSLADLWKVGEGTVRRWRKQVESLIDEGSAELQNYNVSEERIATLKEVLADPYRENEEGDTVAVRQKPKETTPEELAEFWFTIRKSGLFDQRSDGSLFLDQHGFQMEAFNAYICERFNIKSDGIPHQLSMTQLKKIHNWILTDDPEAIARCQEIQRETDALGAARKLCADWKDKVLLAFDEELSPTPGNTYAPARNACLKAFQKVVKARFNGFDFDDAHSASTADALLSVQDTFSEIYTEIEMKEAWVLRFKAQFSDKLAETRQTLEQAWAAARKEMFAALSEYPRNVSEVAFFNRFDERFGHPSGRTRDFTEPTPAITDETLTADIRHFKAATADIQTDTEWMQAMPEPIPLMTLLAQQEHIAELVIKIEGGSRETRIAEIKDAETAAEWIPAELQETLIKAVDKFIYKD